MPEDEILPSGGHVEAEGRAAGILARLEAMREAVEPIPEPGAALAQAVEPPPCKRENGVQVPDAAVEALDERKSDNRRGSKIYKASSIMGQKIVRTYAQKMSRRAQAQRARNRMAKMAGGGSIPGYVELENLAPLQIDEDGFPIFPMGSGTTKYRSNVDRAKIKFLLMYNYSSGNLNLACQEAGITRRFFRENWGKEPEFQKLMEDARDEFIDRAAYRFVQSIGLVPASSVKYNDASLKDFIKRYRPDMFEVPKSEATEKKNARRANIPRAARPPAEEPAEQPRQDDT